VDAELDRLQHLFQLRFQFLGEGILFTVLLELMIKTFSRKVHTWLCCHRFTLTQSGIDKGAENSSDECGKRNQGSEFHG
jgi:hypothetical protein